MIWVTRSQPGADAQAAALRGAGWDVLLEPVLTISAVDPSPLPPADAADPDLVLVVSAHAARLYAQHGAGQQVITRGVTHLCVGRSTAAALGSEAVTLLPEQASSEGLLDVPALQGIGEQDVVWLLAGEGGRSLLEDELSSRCQLQRFALYRRVATSPIDLPTTKLRAAVASSVEGLDEIHTRWRGQGGSLALDLVCCSARIAERARSLGYTNVHDAGGADDQSVVACAARRLA